MVDRYRYFMFARGRVLVLGVLQVACAGLCVICGVMDAVFRKDTPLSSTRTPVWGGMIMAVPGALALFASQNKNHLLVSVLVLATCLSCTSSLIVFGYSCLTLTYGEEDTHVFHQHNDPQVTFVLHRMVKGANATILLSCGLSLLLSAAIAYLSCRSLPFCSCYDTRTGLESLVPQCDPWDTELVPQCDPGDTELVCTWRASDDDRLFNSPAQSSEPREHIEEEERGQSSAPPYSHLT